MFGMKDLIQQAQGLQAKLKDIQDDLAQKTVTGSAGGDMVIVEVSGSQEIISIKIEKELIDPNETEFLQDLIVAATNDALKKSRDLLAEEMAKATGGLKLPGLF